MKEFVAYIIKNLVSNPEGVSIQSSDEGECVRIEIRVAQEDVGKVIGRRGNTINALRTIVRTVATRIGRKVQVELIQDDKPEGEEIVATIESEPEVEQVELAPAPEVPAPEVPAPEVPAPEDAPQEEALA